ncbi:hypothetical protein WJX73_002974 [Symbiochloris irregularis]|uniref:BZIP domain-containing protein n=1 Tax=Symbiochloris irregularis TaxID=706552 RepID=A0AAW1PRV1_9CHLO
MADQDESVQLRQVEISDHSALRHFRHSERQRSRNRKAQQAFRERAKAKTEWDVAAAARNVQQAWTRLHVEKEAFAAERHAWLANSSHITEGLGKWVSPSAEGLAVQAGDSFKVAVLKSPGVPDELLEVLFQATCQSFAICGLDKPAKHDVDFWQLDSHLHFRSNIGKQAIARAVADAEADSSAQSLIRLKDLMLTWMAFMKLCSMNDRSAGADLTRLMFQWVHKYPYEQYGPPPAHHWHIAAARAKLSASQRRQMLTLHQRFHERLHSIRIRAAALPDHLNAFLQGNMDAVSERMSTYPSASSQDHDTVLAGLLREEHEAASQFFFGIRGKVLTSIQDAHIFLAAFPYQPSMDDICQALTGWHNYPDLPADNAQGGPQHNTGITDAAPMLLKSEPSLQSTPLLDRQPPSNAHFQGFPALPTSPMRSTPSNDDNTTPLGPSREVPCSIE